MMETVVSSDVMCDDWVLELYLQIVFHMRVFSSLQVWVGAVVGAMEVLFSPIEVKWFRGTFPSIALVHGC